MRVSFQLFGRFCGQTSPKYNYNNSHQSLCLPVKQRTHLCPSFAAPSPLYRLQHAIGPKVREMHICKNCIQHHEPGVFPVEKVCYTKDVSSQFVYQVGWLVVLVGWQVDR